MAHFEYSSVIPAAPDKVFEFLSVPRNFAETLPSDYTLTFLTSKPLIKKGETINFKLSRFGISAVWSLLVDEYDAPHNYRYRQIRGPFSVWVHTQKVEDHGQGTLLKELIEYDVAFGIFGKLAQDLFLKKELLRIFEWRHKKIQESV